MRETQNSPSSAADEVHSVSFICLDWGSAGLLLCEQGDGFTLAKVELTLHTLTLVVVALLSLGFSCLVIILIILPWLFVHVFQIFLHYRVSCISWSLSRCFSCVALHLRPTSGKIFLHVWCIVGWQSAHLLDWCASPVALWQHLACDVSELWDH